jgi:serine/threonine protein kinase
MGEVYRARDTRLDRDVAIKILPQAFAADAERVARCQREAKVLASLNHPQIAAIYGLVGDGDGVKALVMELVEGEDLAQRLARGAIPVDEALPIAKQIAEALEAAHEQGIIHRDLKSANIKTRPDGMVKVLDFGLAKLAETPGSGLQASGLSLSPTSPARITAVGMLLGTAAYMAPEQAKGRPADKRSDIWAFGCVLYEMLTGRRAFEGEEVAETLGAIIHKEPAWNALPAGTPPYVRTLLRRCLQKDPKKRLPHIGLARLEIDEGQADAQPLQGSGASIAPKGPFWKRALPIGAVAVVALGVAVGWYVARQASRPIVRFPIVLGTEQASIPRSLAISNLMTQPGHRYFASSSSVITAAAMSVPRSLKQTSRHPCGPRGLNAWPSRERLNDHRGTSRAYAS